MMTTETRNLRAALEAAMARSPQMLERVAALDLTDAEATRYAVDACDVIAEQAPYGAARIQAEKKAREAKEAWAAAFPAAQAERVREATEARDARLALTADHGERVRRLAD